MSTTTPIQWTDATSRFVKTAAKRAGVTVAEYVRFRLDGLKFCWRCRGWRPVGEFGRDVTRHDGLAALCVTCRRRPRQLPLIRPTQAERDRLRYARDERYRTERRQHAHARRRGVAPLPVEGIESLTEWFGGRCAYCPAPATTWDHIVPVSKGGRTIPGNIVPACMSCNSRKGNRDVNDFIEAAGVEITSALDGALALAIEWGQLE